MADNGFKINKSLNINPQGSEPANPVSGDVYFDSGVGSFAHYTTSAWSFWNSIGSIATGTNLTSSTFTAAAVKNSVIRMTGATATNIHGMTSSFTAKSLTIYNNSSASVVVKHQSATELTANNRIITPVASDMTLVAGEIAQFIYDSTQSRWLLVSVGSGAGAYAVATTATNGIVTLSGTPGSAPNPKVATLDSSNLAMAAGLTREGATAGAGTLSIGTLANDTAITIGNTSNITTFPGQVNAASIDASDICAFTNGIIVDGGIQSSGDVEVSSLGTLVTNFISSYDSGYVQVNDVLNVASIDRATAASITIGGTTASAISIGRAAIATTILGTASIATIDRAGVLAYGTTNATGINIGHTGITIASQSDISLPIAKHFKYSAARTFYKHLSPLELYFTSGALTMITPSGLPHLRNNASAGTVQISGRFAVPAGATVTALEFSVYNNSGSTQNMTSVSLNLGTADGSSYGSPATALSGASGPNMPTGTTAWYSVTPFTSQTFSATGDGYVHFTALLPSTGTADQIRLHGVRLTYTQLNILPTA